MSKFALPILTVVFLTSAEPTPKAAAQCGTAIDRKLKQAFSDSAVKDAAVKLEFRSQGLLLAASSVTIEPDGRIKLTDCAVARFGEGADPARPGRLTTMRSTQVTLALDKPINGLTDLGDRRVLSAELAGGIRMTFAAP